MGNVCKAKDNEKSVITPDETEKFDKMQSTMSDAQYKAKLEQKLCLFKETPEPVCDLSECNLEKLPSLFPTLRVLRKEILVLKQNRLKSLSSGGVLNDLELLQVLDISYNKFKVIPVDICVLTNLRVSLSQHFFRQKYKIVNYFHESEHDDYHIITLLFLGIVYVKQPVNSIAVYNQSTQTSGTFGCVK